MILELVLKVLKCHVSLWFTKW